MSTTEDEVVTEAEGRLARAGARPSAGRTPAGETPGFPSLTSLPAPEVLAAHGETLRKLLARAAALLDRPGSFAHAHPPAFARAREMHHEAAARYRLWPVVGAARLTWGYFHLLVIKPVLNLAEWVTETPLRFTVAVIAGTVIWYWS